jgi:hypothetical protein
MGIRQESSWGSMAKRNVFRPICSSRTLFFPVFSVSSVVKMPSLDGYRPRAMPRESGRAGANDWW